MLGSRNSDNTGAATGENCGQSAQSQNAPMAQPTEPAKHQGINEPPIDFNDDVPF